MKQTLLGPMWLIHGDIVSDTLAGGQHWDPHVYDALEPYLSGVVIDVGANVGGLTLRFARVAKHVIAFEVHPVLRACLEENARYNNISVMGGLYSCPTVLAPILDGESPSSWAWAPPPRDSDKYDYATQPNAKPFYTDAHVTAIKIDAQGADLHAMLGMQEIIKRDSPVIVFEYEPHLDHLFGHTWVDYVQTLEGWGYKLRNVRNQDWFAWREK